MEEYFYRYRDVHYAPPLNEYDEICGPSTIKLSCDKYLVVKRTDKSVLLRRSLGQWVAPDTRWMRLEARNRFASPTKNEALFHFIKRKERQAGIYAARLESALEAKRLAEDILRKEDSA